MCLVLIACIHDLCDLIFNNYNNIVGLIRLINCLEPETPLQSDQARFNFDDECTVLAVR